MSVGIYLHIPGTKRGAPETALRAGSSYQDEAHNRRLLALAAVRQAKAYGATSDEVAAACGWSQWYSSRPRLSELRALRRIIDSGERRRGKSGRMQAVWVLPEYGRAFRPTPQHDFHHLLQMEHQTSREVLS